jgi:hypothetical protein
MEGQRRDWEGGEDGDKKRIMLTMISRLPHSRESQARQLLRQAGGRTGASAAERVLNNQLEGVGSEKERYRWRANKKCTVHILRKARISITFKCPTCVYYLYSGCIIAALYYELPFRALQPPHPYGFSRYALTS